MPSSASRPLRASHTSSSSLDINRPLRSITVTLLPNRRMACDKLYSDVAAADNQQMFGDLA